MVVNPSTRVDKSWQFSRLRFGFGFYIRRYPKGTIPDRWEFKPFVIWDRKC